MSEMETVFSLKVLKYGTMYEFIKDLYALTVFIFNFFDLQFFKNSSQASITVISIFLHFIFLSAIFMLSEFLFPAYS